MEKSSRSDRALRRKPKLMKVLLTRYYSQILIGTLLIGIVLRWLEIGNPSFWYDEAFSGLTARLDLAQILSNDALDVHPPGYYLLLHYWLALGQSEFVLRSFSALFSVGAILLIYGLGRWLFDRSTAVLAALLMAILPFQIYFAQEARMYGLVIFVTVALMWMFLYAATEDCRWTIWGGYVILSAAGLYIHYFIGFLLLGLHIWFVFDLGRFRPKIWNLLLADGLIIVLFLPQLYQALTRTSAYLTIEAWQAVPNILSPLTAIYYLLFAHRTPIWIAPVAIFLTLALLVLTLWEGRRRSNAENHFEVALWLSLLTPILTVTVISWLAARSIYVERSFAVASPALILLLARGALAAPKISPTPYLLLLLLIPVILTLFNHVITPDPAKPPLRDVFLVIESEYSPGDVSLHLQDASAIPALWYTDQPHLLADVEGAAFIFDTTHRLFGGDVVDWQTALADSDRLWLTVMPGFVGPEQQAVYTKIESTYSRLNMWDWGSIQLYLYDLKKVDQ